MNVLIYFDAFVFIVFYVVFCVSTWAIYLPFLYERELFYNINILIFLLKYLINILKNDYIIYLYNTYIRIYMHIYIILLKSMHRNYV